MMAIVEAIMTCVIFSIVGFIGGLVKGKIYNDPDLKGAAIAGLIGGAIGALFWTLSDLRLPKAVFH